MTGSADSSPDRHGAAVRDGELGGPHHRACVDLLTRAQPPLIVPGPVVAELTYLVGRTLGPHGAAIKLGAASDQCARNVRIEFNTFYDGVRAILMEDDIRGVVINGHLTDQIRGGGGNSGPHLAVALARIAAATPENIISHTYAADNANPLHRIWGPVVTGPAVLTDGGDNPYRAGDDPAFNSIDPTAPGSFQPQNNAAKPYGRYGTSAFP